MKSALFNFFHRKHEKVRPADIMPVSPKSKEQQRFMHKSTIYTVYQYPEREGLFYITLHDQPMKLIEGSDHEQALLRYLNNESPQHESK